MKEYEMMGICQICGMKANRNVRVRDKAVAACNDCANKPCLVCNMTIASNDPQTVVVRGSFMVDDKQVDFARRVHAPRDNRHAAFHQDPSGFLQRLRQSSNPQIITPTRPATPRLSVVSTQPAPAVAP